jgi:antitoxin component YwqK of YwqJK toxin-antitoxin module
VVSKCSDRVKENYKDDKYDGNYTSWYKDGQIHQEVNYKDGKVDGKFTIWKENGQIWFEKNYKDSECISGDC